MRIRPIKSQDESFLFELYASTRYEEIAKWGWEKAEREAFLRMQWTAQNQSYRMQFPNLRQQLVLIHDERAGRILTCRTKHEFILVDITLLPSYCGLGYGSMLIETIKEEAKRHAKPIRLAVRNDNRAKRLYVRLGFTCTEEDDMYSRMEWYET